MKRLLFAGNSSDSINSFRNMIKCAILEDPVAGFDWWPTERSSEVTRGHQQFFANNFRLGRDRDVREVPLCSSLHCASTDMQFDLFGSTWVVTWPWPEVKFSNWLFKVKKYMIRRVLTREERWWQNECATSSKWEVIGKIIFEANPPFWNLMTSGA